MLAAGAAVELAAVGLQVTDALCQMVTHSVDPNLQGTYANVAKTLTGSLLKGSPFIASVIAAVFVLGGMSLWLELILRSAAIYLAVFFLPLALAGLVWPATAHWAKRMVETLVAVILSKFVIVVALSLAVRAAANGSTADDVLAGAAIFLLAAFAPFVLLRFTPIIEAAAISHLEGVSRRPVDAARRAGSRAVNAPGTTLGALLVGRGTSSSQEAAPAAAAVEGLNLAATGGQVDREFAMVSGSGGSRAATDSSASSPGADDPGGGSWGGRSSGGDSVGGESVGGESVAGASAGGASAGGGSTGGGSPGGPPALLGEDLDDD